MIYLFILLFILSNLYYHILRGGGLQCGREKLFFLGGCKTRKTLFSWSKIYQSRHTSRKYWKCCVNVFRTSLDQVEKKSKNCTRKTSFLNESQAWRKIELLPLIPPPPTPSPHTRFFLIFPDWNDGLSHKSRGSAELLLRKGNLLNKKRTSYGICSKKRGQSSSCQPVTQHSELWGAVLWIPRMLKLFRWYLWFL